MARRRRKHRTRRHRERIGLLTPEELVVHRELEFLRAAGRRDSSRRQHVRGGKYLQARRIAARGLLVVKDEPAQVADLDEGSPPPDFRD